MDEKEVIAAVKAQRKEFFRQLRELIFNPPADMSKADREAKRLSLSRDIDVLTARLDRLDPTWTDDILKPFQPK